MPYSVYRHTSPSGKVYIGITGQRPEDRWQGGLGYRRNEYFFRAIVKYGWDNFAHEILHTGLSKDEACAAEVALIAAYHSNDRAYGYNLTTGGESGKRHSEESKRIMREKKKGKPSCRKGTTHTEESKRKMSAAHTGKRMPTGSMRPAWDARRRRVIQSTPDGRVVAVHESVTAAAVAVGGNNSNIAACASGKRRAAFGFSWAYEVAPII